MNKFFLTLKNFGFSSRNSSSFDLEAISCEQIQGAWSFLWMKAKEELRNESYEYTVEATTLNHLQKYFSNPGFGFWQRLVLVDCSKISQVSDQLQAMIEKANAYKGFSLTDYHRRQTPETLTTGFLSYYFRATENGLDFGSGIEPDLPIDKIKFCGNKPWELDTKDGYERYLLTAGLFSFCSWRLAPEDSINDAKDFYVKIIFTVYDHVLNCFFDISIDVCSLINLERRANNGLPLFFLRYTMIMDYWNEDFIKEYVFYTVRNAYGDDPSYYGSPLAQLTFNYQFPREYLNIADEWGVAYAYY